MEITKMDTIIFLRTSTEEQNPQNQLSDCLKLAERLNLNDHEVREEKVSAYKDNVCRPVFEGILRDIKEGRIKNLIIWDFDRIYRNRIKFKEFLQLLKAYNVNLHSFRQDWFEELYKIPAPWNDIVQELMINIYGHIAEEESKKKSERIKLAVRKNGVEPTKSYKNNKWGRKELSQNVITQILDLAKQDKTIRQISKEVFYYDKNNNKKFVSKSFVHKLLSNTSKENLSLNDVQ